MIKSQNLLKLPVMKIHQVNIHYIPFWCALVLRPDSIWAAYNPLTKKFPALLWLVFTSFSGLLTLRGSLISAPIIESMQCAAIRLWTRSAGLQKVSPSSAAFLAQEQFQTYSFTAGNHTDNKNYIGIKRISTISTEKMNISLFHFLISTM